MIRVANNGVSAVIDAAGRVRARIDLDTIGYADVVLPASGGRTSTLASATGRWFPPCARRLPSHSGCAEGRAASRDSAAPKLAHRRNCLFSV